MSSTTLSASVSRAHLTSIWVHKHLSVAWSPFHTHKLQGNLSISNIEKYYQDAWISQLTLLHATRDAPLWVFLKLLSYDQILIIALLWLPYSAFTPFFTPLMLHGLKELGLLRCICKLLFPFLPLLPIVNNPLFQPGIIDSLSWWTDHCFTHIHYSPPSSLQHTVVGLTKAPQCSLGVL